MSIWSADFETTYDLNHTRVWAWAMSEVGNVENVKYGTHLDEFMEICSTKKQNYKMYFHNLKFDGEFILYWLEEHGFKHVQDSKQVTDKTYTTLISDTGLWYSIEVFFEKTSKRVNKVTFQDSLKLIPMPVEAIAKTFDLPITKLSIDYREFRPLNHVLTPEEIEYIKNDVQIVAYALDYFFKQGLNKMTIGSCALNDYKELIDKKVFRRYFPVPTYDEQVRQSYKGGFTYLNPKFAGKTVKNIMVFDVNSLYPSVMYDEYLPFGTPIAFEGQYKPDPIYNVYVQQIKCSFEIKKGKIPTIQIKKSGLFKENEYLLSSNDEEVTLTLTSVDLELFFQHYDVYNPEYLGGWMFKSTKGLFTKYIDKWTQIKIESTENGNKGMRTIAKLFLNSLYGKFGTACLIKSKIPYYSKEDGKIHYKLTEEYEEREGVYIAMASFITSYARKKTITSAQKIQDDYLSGKSKNQFIYSDTDSLHILSPDFEIPSCLDIHPTKLGAWKYESKASKGKFLRQKCYIEMSTEDIESENPEYEMKVTVSGMPKGCYPFVTFRNFKLGTTYEGKLDPKHVPGGTVLVDNVFTIVP